MGDIQNGCVYESGGGSTNTGSATIVALADGSPARASRVDRNSATFVAKPGMLIVRVYRSRDTYETTVGRIRPDLAGTDEVLYEERNIEGGFAAYLDGKHVADSLEEGWTNVSQPQILAALRAAWAKSRCYHCRDTHYVAMATSSR